MEDVPYIRDYTAVVHHRNKLAAVEDINFSGLPGGGIDLPAAGVGLVAMGVAILPVGGLWWLLAPWNPWFAMLPIILIGVVVYGLVQRDGQGRETVNQKIKLMILAKRHQPGFVVGMDADVEPTHVRWLVIVQRPAGQDAITQPVRQYEHYASLNPMQGLTWPEVGETSLEWQLRRWWRAGADGLSDDALEMAVNHLYARDPDLGALAKELLT